jgi:cell division protein FtsI (penicillin-binding protein 3)
VDEKICSDETLRLLKECLEGVCTEGTAANLFKGTAYKVAGKTGTALVANGKYGYAEQIYQASFAGYFPAENPQYTCLVVIVNKPHAAAHHGADVAGPVFKEIADRLYSTYIRQSATQMAQSKKADSSLYRYAGMRKELALIGSQLNLRLVDSTSSNTDWTIASGRNNQVVLSSKPVNTQSMPDIKGMVLKDVVYLCENIGLKVNAKGKGKVMVQSIQPGQPFAKGQVIEVQLN